MIETDNAIMNFIIAVAFHRTLEPKNTYFGVVNVCDKLGQAFFTRESDMRHFHEHERQCIIESRDMSS